MRTISALALQTLVTQKGIEPLILIEVYWDGVNSTTYCDRKFEFAGVQGKILEVANLDNVVNISGSSNSQSIGIKLDDIDGSIKNIYDNIDIHKKKVIVYQWFSDIPFSDRFVLFTGQINSPIIWSAGERTLSFDVVSQLEDAEIGYSVEEGDWSYIPSDLIGKAWPLPFGTCPQIPLSLQIEPIPTGTTTEGFGFHDENLEKQMYDLLKQGQEILANIQKLYNDEFAKYMEDVNNHDRQYGVQGIFHNHEDFASDVFGTEYINERLRNLDELARQSQDAWAQYIDLMQQRTELEQQLEDQMARERSSVGVHNGNLFPQGAMEVALGSVLIYGYMSGDRLYFQSVDRNGPDYEDADTSKPVDDSGNPIPADKIKHPWQWIAAGQTIQIRSALPIRYIAAMLPCTVLNVIAYRSRDFARVLTPIPQSYYSVSLENYGAITATIITLVKPLSYYKDEGWDDDIYVDLVSPIGPNTCDIMAWLINTYAPGKGIDATTFNATRSAVNPFQSNFCLFDRKNILTALQEIAYQARCAVWLKNDVFYFRYLPNEPAATETITESDLIYGSLELHHTDTESIITKLIATYKVSYAQGEPNKIILRNNVSKYGVHEQTTDWYIYANPSPVDLAATFWIIRLSNTWKLVSFRTPLHKLRIEAFDAITINFTNNYACYGSVTGIVQSVELDSDKLELSFMVWLPVRLGEMVKYNFAWPVDSDQLIFAKAEDNFTGPGADTGGDLTPINRVSKKAETPKGNAPVTKTDKREHQNDGASNPGEQEVDNTIYVIPEIDRNDQPRPQYDERRQRAQQSVTPIVPAAPPDINKTIPGVVTEIINSGEAYRVRTYPHGTGNIQKTVTVRPFNPEEVFQLNDWVNVTYVTTRRTDSEGKETIYSFIYILSGTKPGVYRGEVVSGSGATYQVQILVGTVTKTVTCTQLQIHTMETIPAGTKAIVGEYTDNDGKKYFMQVPVWME